MDVTQTIEDAFDRFEDIIQDLDARAFRVTQLQDVYQAAHVIERDREQNKRMRNLKRIEPLLQILSELAKAIASLCPDIPHVSYIWVCSALVV